MNRRRVNVCLFISDSSNLVRRGTKRRQRGHVPPSAGQEPCRDTTWSCRQYHQVIKTAVLVRLQTELFDLPLHLGDLLVHLLLVGSGIEKNSHRLLLNPLKDEGELRKNPRPRGVGVPRLRPCSWRRSTLFHALVDRGDDGAAAIHRQRVAYEGEGLAFNPVLKLEGLAAPGLMP